MKNIVLGVFLLMALPSAAQLKLTLHISDIRADKGKILIGVYNQAKGFLDVGTAVKKLWVSPKVGTTTVNVDNLPPGDYAVTLFHDLNGDGICNLSIIGYPKEPFGFSKIHNYPIFRKPNFEQTKFSLEKSKDVSITMAF